MNFGYLSWNINHSGDLNFSFRAQTYIELVSRRFFRIQRSVSLIYLTLILLGLL
jgi:hypothetical protein